MSNSEDNMEQDEFAPDSSDLDLGAPSTEPLDKQTKELVQLIQQNPEFLRALYNAASNKFPEPLRRKGRPHGTYYKRAFAVQLVPFLDMMVDNRKSLIFYYKKFNNCNPRTLYLRILQSFLYIVDYLDTDTKKYAQLRAETEICQEAKGVTIKFADELMANYGKLDGTVIGNEQTSLEWKAKVDEFIETGKPGEKLEIKGLQLTDEQIESLRESLLTMEEIAPIITNDYIKLIKIPQ